MEYVVIRRNYARSLNYHRTQSHGSNYHKPRALRCLIKDNGAARCEQHYPRSETHDAPAGRQRFCNLLVCGERFGFMFVSIVHLFETDTAVLLHLQDNNCEFAVIRKIRVREQVRNVHAIDKIAKFATQINCTANTQAEPQTAQGRGVFVRGGSGAEKYNRNSD